MRKATYKGGNLPIVPGAVCDVRLIWDDDCEYVYVYVYVWTLSGSIKCVYDVFMIEEQKWRRSGNYDS